MTTNHQVAEASVKYLAETAGQAVPAGYKQTEIGVIPADWGLSDIENISLIPMQNGLFYEPKRKGKGIPLINVGDMYKSAPIDVTTLDLFEATANEVKVFKVQIGDLFFTRSSVVPTGIAYCNIFSEEVIDAVFDSHLIRVRPDPELMDARYLYLNCIANHARKFLISSAKTATMTTIDQGAIKKCPVLLPPRDEQTAIANALSDVDALINELEKLIAKKQAIKTATMQQLLTGRIRLTSGKLKIENGERKNHSQFSILNSQLTKQSELGEIPEDWKCVPFSNVMSIRHGKSQKNVETTNGKYPIFATGGQIGTASTYLYDKPSVLIGRKGTIDKPRFADTPFWTVDTLFYSEIKQHADAKFIFYQFCMIDWMQYNEASGVPSLNASTIESVLTCLPTHKEQTAIATILSDMDAEIQTLQQRLSKTRQIKQGMMQELLTGRIRLIKG